MRSNIALAYKTGERWATGLHTVFTHSWPSRELVASPLTVTENITLQERSLPFYIAYLICKITEYCSDRNKFPPTFSCQPQFKSSMDLDVHHRQCQTHTPSLTPTHTHKGSPYRLQLRLMRFLNNVAQNRVDRSVFVRDVAADNK